MRWAQSVFDKDIKIDKSIGSWKEEVEGFFKDIELLDKYISQGLPSGERIFEKLLQGPLSDAMTHVGQLSMIRRIAGDPIKGEDFFESDIRI